MKKMVAEDKKLKLDRRTIRVLTEKQLPGVVGGATSTPDCRSYSVCGPTSGL